MTQDVFFKYADRIKVKRENAFGFKKRGNLRVYTKKTFVICNLISKFFRLSMSKCRIKRRVERVGIKGREHSGSTLHMVGRGRGESGSTEGRKEEVGERREKEEKGRAGTASIPIESRNIK